ncbi:MAG: RtcB family protein [Candidatus Hydrogenedentes bacterium]|nr:RtcB family protein [Candidatus Hydrogenedentota bacterium]
MKSRELANLGIPRGEPMQIAKAAIAAAAQAGFGKQDLRKIVRELADNPRAYTSHETFGELANALLTDAAEQARFVPRAEPAPYKKWGKNLDEASVDQMRNACALPVSVAGALMPDAHVGYGLPIGGVLATRNAVIPYAVGVDIACRMKMTVLDLPVGALTGQTDRLTKALEGETRFGIGASFRERRQHDVLDEDWRVSPITAQHKDKAWAQLGTSGSGNHFVEYGTLVIHGGGLPLPAGTYLALLSHSGSRGTGASVADHYSKLAMKLHRELPKELQHLAWLDLDSEAGREYWAAMELMGKYAAANHACIHRHIAKTLGAKVLMDIENHHNFAWKEVHNGERVIVHRKGATPAGEGALGIIPGSMAAPGFIVRGKGNPLSLNSAAHGAGRQMSRTQAIKTFTWSQTKKLLAERGVTVLSAGLDEVPMAYKNIEDVMAAQSDLVEILARFDPKLVKMAPAGERAED